MHKYLFKILLLSLLAVYPEVGLLYHMIILWFYMNAFPAERKAKTKHETKTNVKIIKIATMQCDSCLSFVIPFYIILPTNPAVQIFHPFCMDTYCFKNIAVQGQTVLGLNSSLGNLLANLSLSFLICTMEMTLYDVWKETSTIPGTEYLINGNQYL